ncbi:MAG: UDP-glucose/GDP-mannose dehydrogenase family protein [Gammaproteobacteria bacterium]|nr:UDP-glucose/GDP-mannose dehydrogenase family protein [Gammaproteobacteria bacterium]
MRISVFGSGYVGLVTGTCFSEVGNHVTCVDIDAARVERLSQGESPIYEPGLTELLKKNIAEQRLQFTTDAAKAISDATLIFIAVGTPQADDGSANMNYVWNVAKTIGQHMSDYRVIINKSTVPVGTGDKVREIIQAELEARGLKIEFDVVSNPEFLKEGSAIADCMRPDRIVIGTNSDKAIEKMHALYAPFNRNHERMIIMDLRSAELTKYAANAMLATKISFMNEMSRIAEKVGADIEQVRHGIGSDARIGYSFIYPGCGYGGSCFPKDVLALQHTAKVHGYDTQILTAVHEVNQRQKHVLLEKIESHFGKDLTGKTIAVWGLAFKPNTDDIRDASSQVLLEGLWKAGAKVQAYDPEAMPNIAKAFGKRDDLHLCEHAEHALDNADALVVVTEWTVFKSPDFDVIKQKLTSSVIFDGRNLYDPAQLKKLGFQYYSIGRRCLI